MTDTTKRRYTADLYAHVVLEFTFKGRNEWEGRCHLGQLGFLFGQERMEGLQMSRQDAQ